MDQSKTPVRLIALAALLVVGGGALAYALMGKKTEVRTESTTSTTATQSTQTTTSTYKDGTYTAIGSYLSPGGTEQIGVTVTLKNDVITSASITPKPVSDDGARFQNIFSQNFKQYVIGKDISGIHLTNVSGSSLTPEGFNDALAKIETQAKA